MKLFASSSVVSAVALLLLTAACGGSNSNNAEPKTATSQAALTSADSSDAPKKTAAEEWAEKKVAAEVAASKGKEVKASADSADPLAMNSELEESSIPKVEITPAKQVRGKSPAELNAAMGVVKSSSSVDDAAKKLTARLGKPTFVESPKNNDQAKRRIWTAPLGNQCQRLVLEQDGSVELETASKSDWRMLSATARQNPCTGEIKRGISK